MPIINKPLTNLRLELLKLFSLDLSEEDLLAVRRMLAKYFGEKASDEMDRLWNEKGWTDETMEEWLCDDKDRYFIC